MQKEIKCQCPSSGLLHFYGGCHIESQGLRSCVNALHRAYSISTGEKNMAMEYIYIVSMPFIGLTPFLRLRTRRRGARSWVSMPFIGLTPFLRYHDRTVDDIFNVSMPFIGLTPFLPIPRMMYWSQYRVSMPFIGLTPFLLPL